MAEIPDLSGVATKNLVEQVQAGSFKASYINWSRTMDLLRKHAPGWQVESVPAADGGLVHRAPVGGFLLLQFKHLDGTVTTPVPHAVMDNRNNPIAFDKITARDVTDSHRRGSCLASAFVFGLAYELWAKMPLESGYASAESAAEVPKRAAAAKAPTTRKAKAAPAVAKEEEAAEEGAAETPQDGTPTLADFRSVAKAAGFTAQALKFIESRIGDKYAQGIATIQSKTPEQIQTINQQAEAAQQK